MARRGSHHSRVGALHPRRTAFDLSYEKKFTCDFGELIPVMCDEVVPGDYFRIRTQTVIRTQPMFAPLLHEVNVTVHYFFVPYRLLWANWESFITGGVDGNYVGKIPTWPSGIVYNPTSGFTENIPDAQWFGKRTLWDYFGFPLHTSAGGHYNPSVVDSRPLAFPFRAYNLVWNDYYRDENFQGKAGLSNTGDQLNINTAKYLTYNDGVLLDQVPYSFADRRSLPYLRNWTKDYFTSALPFQQRGQAPAFPVSGILDVNFVNNFNDGIGGTYGEIRPYDQNSGNINNAQYAQRINNPPGNFNVTIPGPAITTEGPMVVGPANVNLGTAVSFNVNDLRRIVQLQKWMERNARGGVRYTEFLTSHFGVSPNDERLDRPEYIGGTKSHLVVSEVLQTSSNAGRSVGTGVDNTPQGNMSGHGIMASSGNIGGYFVKEFGLIMGIMSIMPTPSYEDGIDRQWLRKTNTDFFFPEFVNLSEQGIYNAEIFANGYYNANDTTNSNWNAVWGYQPQYDEMRIKRNMVCADMRVNTTNNISFWHLGRHFTQLPRLGSNFVRLTPDQFDRAFAVDDFPHFIVSHANIIKAVRPLPYIGEPGLIDHH